MEKGIKKVHKDGSYSLLYLLDKDGQNTSRKEDAVKFILHRFDSKDNFINETVGKVTKR